MGDNRIEIDHNVLKLQYLLRLARPLDESLARLGVSMKFMDAKSLKNASSMSPELLDKLIAQVEIMLKVLHMAFPTYEEFCTGDLGQTGLSS